MKVRVFAWCVILGVMSCAVVACSDGGPVVLEVSPFGTRSPDTRRTRMELYTHTVRSSSGATDDAAPRVRVQLRNPETGYAVWGGTVAVNGVALDSHHVLDNVFYEGRQWAGAVPIRSSGSYNVFSIEGSGDFPALTDSIRSLTGKTGVRYPTPTESVSRSAALMIRWSSSGEATQVTIRVQDSSTATVQRVLKGDPGSCLLISGELAALKPGPLTVSVSRARTHDGNVNGREYTMLIGSVEEIRTTLVTGR